MSDPLGRHTSRINKPFVCDRCHVAHTTGTDYEDVGRLCDDCLADDGERGVAAYESERDLA